MTRCFKVSGLAVKRLMDSQTSRGVPKKDLRSSVTAHRIRWSGYYRSLNRSRLLERDFKMALTGDACGSCPEMPAPSLRAGGGGFSDSDDSDDPEEEEEEAGSVAANTSDDDDDQVRQLFS